MFVQFLLKFAQYDGGNETLENVMRNLLILLFSLGLLGCASTTPQGVRTGEICQRHASAEETSSVMYGSIRNWRPVGQDAVLIEFNRNRHYLFELSAPCSTEIPFAQSIRLLTSSSQRVDRFDRIQVGSAVCRITSIREVDFAAVQADLEALRASPGPALETIDTDLIHADDYSGGT